MKKATRIVRTLFSAEMKLINQRKSKGGADAARFDEAHGCDKNTDQAGTITHPDVGKTADGFILTKIEDAV